jgi:hypothetical protein
MKRIIAVTIALAIGVVSATEAAPISVRVKQDGLMCEVLNQITECSALPEVLAQEFGVDRNILLVVTPDGCGESAIGDLRVVVDRLRAAGYLQVSVAGSLAKPNHKCVR